MQNNRHINTLANATATANAGSSTLTESASLVAPASVSTSSHSKRPDLEEVIRSLHELGRSDVAARITEMTGVEHKPSKQQQAQLRPQKQNSDGDAVAAPKQKYLRGRYRFAYIYVNSATASLDEQTKILTAFLKASKAVAKSCPYTAGILAGNYEVVPITLPRNFVTLSIRVNMDALKHSKLLGFAEKYQTMKVYFRKPRKDTQHLADQLKQQQAQQKQQLKSSTRA